MGGRGCRSAGVGVCGGGGENRRILVSAEFFFFFNFFNFIDFIDLLDFCFKFLCNFQPVQFSRPPLLPTKTPLPP